MAAPTTDKTTRTLQIGDDSNGLVLLVVGAGADQAIDIDGSGAADLRDEDGGIRLDRDLAARLATELFSLLTG